VLLAEPAEIPTFPTTPDIRLIATDMDGTLLDDDKRLHEQFWPLLEELDRRGVLFCPASGRQYTTLLREFEIVAGGAADMVFIADNGSMVMRGGQEISSTCLPREEAHRLVLALRQTLSDGVDAGAVVSTKRSSFVERSDTAFLDQVGRYNVDLQIVPDLLEVIHDDVLKIAVYDFGSAEHTTLPRLAGLADALNLTVTAEHWLDVNAPTATKGAAVSALQDAYGITPAQTMVFGDFLNDLEMMDTADYSFAMSNAHPKLRARARYTAPSNNDNGVIRTIASVLDLPIG
jgi:hypothetical protein